MFSVSFCHVREIHGFPHSRNPRSIPLYLQVMKRRWGISSVFSPEELRKASSLWLLSSGSILRILTYHSHFWYSGANYGLPTSSSYNKVERSATASKSLMASFSSKRTLSARPRSTHRAAALTSGSFATSTARTHFARAARSTVAVP